MSLADVQLATECQTMVAYIPIVGSTLVRNYCTYADHSIQRQHAVAEWCYHMVVSSDLLDMDPATFLFIIYIL